MEGSKKIPVGQLDMEGIAAAVSEAVFDSRIEVDLPMGDWDMTDFFSLGVPHSLGGSEWKSIRIHSVVIRNDADTIYYTPYDLVRIEVSSTHITIYRVAADLFDSVDFDTPTGYNRGNITFTYIPAV